MYLLFNVFFSGGFYVGQHWVCGNQEDPPEKQPGVSRGGQLWKVGGVLFFAN